MKIDDTLSNWRKEIDGLDEELLRVLTLRMDVVEKIGNFKKIHGLVAHDPKRWEQMLAKRLSLSSKQLTPEFIQKLYTLIHEQALSVEDPKAVTARRLDTVPEYIFSRLAKVIAQVEQKSKKKVINLGPGTPDIKPSPTYIRKLKEFVNRDDAHRYPPYGASEDFSQALIGWYKKRFGVSIGSNELLPLNGAKDGISHLPLAILNPGDEVLVPDPGYPAFSAPAIMIGVVPIHYSLTEINDFKIDIAELKKLVTPKTKALWVNFPSNPTGQVATLEELVAIVAFAKQHGLILLYDNAYSEITFDGFTAPSILEVPGARDIAVEIGSFSKMFSFAGLRMGWVVGRADVIAALAKAKSQMDSGLSMPLQHLGAYALSHQDKEWHARMIAAYRNRRDKIAALLNKLGLTFDLPKGSLYIWAKISDGEESCEAFSMRILEEQNIVLTPGTAFGKNGARYVRASICVTIE